ncbi:secretin N-terminal domain-containing protein [Desulfamplus magnetovallimortis]|uniref:secretin N-terminal domain-containing protein n=1 Tax=Desulfamplus magnetovallimortis TaxID=1246637 RepID=UPI001647E6B6|nr:secretin N-terminal domain-containing protein [Desulfamplus magnetovallimortis]
MRLFILAFLLTSMLVLQGCMGAGRMEPLPCTEIDSMDLKARVACYQKQLETVPPSMRHSIELALKKEQYTLSILYMEQGSRYLEDNNLSQASDFLSKSIEAFPGNDRASQLLIQTLNRQKSLELVDRAESLIAQKSFDSAKKLLEEALTLYPENREALGFLEHFKNRNFRSSEYDIFIESDQKFSLRFKETAILDVFDIISKLADINIVFDKDVRQQNISVFVKDIYVMDFLEMLLKTNNLAAKQTDKKTLLIYPDTPQKQKEYQDLQVRTFYLSYLKAKDTLPVIAKVLNLKDIIANETTNTITVRDSDKSIDIVAKLIKANDIPEPEVVLNVEMLEVSSTLEEELGLSYPDVITFGVSNTSSGINSSSAFSLAGFGSLNDLGTLSSRELYLSIPTVKLNLLKQDGDTRILAKPSVRVSNNQKATILLGERIPLRSNRRVEDNGAVTYDYQYQDVGIKLVATPDVNRNEEIRLILNLEQSSLGSNVGTSEDPQYAINTRSADTVLTVKDGSTVIIGGLTRKEDRKTVNTVPLLGDIPVLKKLFTHESNGDTNTDLLITITPVIISGAPLPDDDTSTFWSGNWQRIHTTEPYIKKMEQHDPVIPEMPKAE